MANEKLLASGTHNPDSIIDISPRARGPNFLSSVSQQLREQVYGTVCGASGSSFWQYSAKKMRSVFNGWFRVKKLLVLAMTLVSMAVVTKLFHDFQQNVEDEISKEEGIWSWFLLSQFYLSFIAIFSTFLFHGVIAANYATSDLPSALDCLTMGLFHRRIKHYKNNRHRDWVKRAIYTSWFFCAASALLALLDNVVDMKEVNADKVNHSSAEIILFSNEPILSFGMLIGFNTVPTFIYLNALFDFIIQSFEKPTVRNFKRRLESLLVSEYSYENYLKDSEEIKSLIKEFDIVNSLSANSNDDEKLHYCLRVLLVCLTVRGMLTRENDNQFISKDLINQLAIMLAEDKIGSPIIEGFKQKIASSIKNMPKYIIALSSMAIQIFNFQLMLAGARSAAVAFYKSIKKINNPIGDSILMKLFNEKIVILLNIFISVPMVIASAGEFSSWAITALSSLLFRNRKQEAGPESNRELPVTDAAKEIKVKNRIKNLVNITFISGATGMGIIQGKISSNEIRGNTILPFSLTVNAFMQGVYGSNNIAKLLLTLPDKYYCILLQYFFPKRITGALQEKALYYYLEELRLAAVEMVSYLTEDNVLIIKSLLQCYMRLLKGANLTTVHIQHPESIVNNIDKVGSEFHVTETNIRRNYSAGSRLLKMRKPPTTKQKPKKSPSKRLASSDDPLKQQQRPTYEFLAGKRKKSNEKKELKSLLPIINEGEEILTEQNYGTWSLPLHPLSSQ